VSKGTAAVGLGWSHQKARKAALAALVEGEPCELCGAGMWLWQALDLDHEVARALGGKDGRTRLTHASCNRSRGASMGNRLRGARRRGTAPVVDHVQGPTSREW